MPKCAWVLKVTAIAAHTEALTGHRRRSCAAGSALRMMATERAMKKVAGVLGLLLLVAAGVLGGLWWSMVSGARQTVAERRAHIDEQFRSVEARIAADEALIADLAVLAPVEGPDAGPLLLQHIRFGATQVAPPISDALAERLGLWMGALHDEELASVDLSWMAQLPGFGFWDIEGAGSPLEQQPFAALTEDLPRFVDVKNIAHARLLQGLKTRTTSTAATEVRALARLALSTETMVGEMTAVALLTMEQRAFADATAIGEDTTGWTPPSTAQTDALKRVLFASLSQHTLLSSDAARAHRFPVGTCAALREGLGTALYFSNFARAEFAERYVELGNALRGSPCRLRRLRAAWANPSTTTAVVLSSVCVDEKMQATGDCAGPDAALGLPGVRSFLTNTLLLVAAPETLAGYLKPHTSTTP